MAVYNSALVELSPSLYEPHGAAYVSSYEALLHVVNAVLGVLILGGNVLTIYVVCAGKCAKTTHNITLVSVAVTDVFVVCCVLPLHLAVPRRDILGDAATPFFCKLSRYAWYWAKTVSVYSIVAMVLDKQARPRKSRAFSGRCLFFLNLLWFFGASYNIWQVVLTASAKLTLSDPGGNITVRRCVPLDAFPALLIAAEATDCLVIFLIPGVIIARLYLSLLRCHGDVPVARTAKQWRRFFLSIALVLIFLACHLPGELQRAHALNAVTPPSSDQLTLTALLETVAFAQGFLNLIAYVCFSPELYACVWKVLFCPWCVAGNGRDAGTGRLTNVRLTPLPVIVTNVDGTIVSETVT